MHRRMQSMVRTHSDYYDCKGSRGVPIPQCIYAMDAILAKQASLQNKAPHFYLDSDSRPLGIDNRATAFISGDINDFEVGHLRNTDQVVRGFGGTTVRGVKRGTAIIRLEDDTGRVHIIRLRNSYYVPGSKDRLFSPQHFAQEMKRQKKGPASETTDATCCILRWGGFQRTIPLDSATNVATLQSAPSYNNFHAYYAEAGFDSDDDPIAYDASIVSDDESDDEDSASASTTPLNWPDAGGEIQWKDSQLPNTEIPRKQPAVIEQDDLEVKAKSDESLLLDYHYRYSHASFAKLQRMAKDGILPKRLSHCRIPVCAACMYGKATKKPWRSKQSKHDNSSTLPNAPGGIVSVDQLRSPTPGFIAQLTGNLTKDRYNYATVFVDGYSGKGYVHLQKTQSASETLEAKQAYERLCLRDGITVKHYHADNGVFRAKQWTDDCQNKQQGFTFAGVDAHHQNGKAEARIRRLQELTRTSLLHAQRMWPQEICAHLWPYALRMASESINSTPNLRNKHQGRTPEQLFSGSDVNSNPKHWKHFGSPVFVLDQALRGSSRIHGKWKDRSRIGIYLGRSPQHSRSIALVLNPETGLVSPQFHVQHDSSFDTVRQLYSGDHQSKWQIKAGLVAPPNPREPERDETTTTKNSLTRPTSDSEGGTSTEGTANANERVQHESTVNADSEPEITVMANNGERQRDEDTPSTQPSESRPHRVRRPPQRLIEVMSTEVNRDTHSTNEIFSLQALFPRDDSELYAMKAKADPDTLYLHEARKQPDWEHFSEAMVQEVEQQVQGGVYTIVRRSELPEGATVLPAVWQLRRKRDVRTGKVKKYKARNNIDGSRMQEGVHYEQTYAPVAGWTAIRLLLAFILLLRWHSVQLDYVLAFPQAPAIRLMFMEIPKGFTIDGVDNADDHVLQINRNIYGGKDAGRTWFLYLKDKLQRVGFEQSKLDECIFYKGSMVYVLYTDDSILAGPNKEEIEATIKDMKAELDITVEDNLTDFLGVNIDYRDDGTIKLSQAKLVEQILHDLHLNQDNATTKETPAASSKILSRHEDARPFDNHFDYRSVIGKLHYLVAGSRSEIAYAVHQCARFAHAPTMEHSKAVKWIGRYLKGTTHEGTILRPDKTKQLEVYVDADFAGNWDPEIAANDRSTARSRHGYYILYGGVPIAWKSTLQQEIALSSTESEITGLSYALREAIPIIELLREMETKGFEVNAADPKIHCEVFEDNSGAIEIAKHQKYRPRTKHLNVRLWHFRTYVDRGEISIVPIRSAEQPADILTKPLNEVDFKRHRKRINGW
jgi:Reverse transcriptase (RNA-dependent DNA polymerase)